MPNSDKAAQAVHLLATISKLGLKAFSSRSKQTLTFLILNDTIQVIRYNRAILWEFDNHTPSLIGISGEAVPNTQSELSTVLLKTVQKIEDPKTATILTEEQISAYKKLKTQQSTISVLWLPIMSDDQLQLGLWLERWDGVQWQFDEIEILSFLMQNYAAAWEKFQGRSILLRKDKLFKFNKTKLALITTVFALLILIRIPLRVSAPCEVIPAEPILITAPLEGIIEEIKVDPGQYVRRGTILFEYDKRVPLEELKTAEKQVQIIQAEIDKNSALAHTDPQALSEIGVLTLRLKKEQNLYQLARYKSKKLIVRAPIDGAVTIEDPDEWRGNPVKIGEKVMVISDPNITKVKIWIPESDNIELNPETNIKIILNVHPDKSYEASISYISSYSTLSDKSVPSFIAEANWAKQYDGVKLGLKGTAILYGENVSVLYWLIRRPWTYMRHLFGW